MKWNAGRDGSRRLVALGVAFGLAAGLAACGDESLDGLGDSDVPAGDLGFFDVDAPGSDADVTPDALPDITPDAAPDTTTDAVPDTSAEVTPDTVTPDEGPEIPPDTTPPTVILSSPEQGESDVAVPFTITIVFSEPVSTNNIVNQTVKLYDVDGKEVPIVIAIGADKMTVNILPQTQTFLRASSYRLRIQGSIVADFAGNKMVDPYELRFFTESYPGMEAYAEVAARYAPRLVADTTDVLSRARVPLAFDADGDWDGSNTQQWLQKDAAELSPAVYFDVAETYTHYFIHYTFIFPWGQTSDTALARANAVSGLMVTVAKATDDTPERPIAATTYWRQGTGETNQVFATTEGGLVGPQGKGQYGDVTEVYAQDTLFPGGHFSVYLSPTYESCAWIHTTNPGAFATCVLNEGVKATMTRLIFAHDPEGPTLISKVNGWPSDISELVDENDQPLEAIGYELVPTLPSLWARRTQVGDALVYSSTFDYATEAGRPGDGSKLPDKFVDSVNDTDAQFGRPPWAWRHEPTSGKLFGIKAGWLGMDPALYTCKRHGSVAGDSAVPACNATSASTFSTVYCFDGYAAIDQRADNALCQ
ncbi:MAG: Ig-like domain-containing protein [Deltaproteobacteria bacterium]|nr:Ig-like domain-containing protein [Deltaproteobacteria bacterium]MCB9787403.1 Ig-like domain-containing protein [Deltaproteobacteria bacterium]